MIRSSGTISVDILLRAWNVILQQAWTMLLKDRLRNDGGAHFKKGGNPKKRNEPCKRFNKGKCSYGLACIFDHLLFSPGMW